MSLGSLITFYLDLYADFIMAIDHDHESWRLDGVDIMSYFDTFIKFSHENWDETKLMAKIQNKTS